MFNNRDLEKMQTTLIAMSNKAIEESESIILEVTKEAAEDMHNNVDRIDTERMKGSVSYITTKLRGKFGWYIGDTIDQDQAVRNRPDPAANHYFVFQEHGFRNAFTGANVPPMHALLNSFVKARERLKDALGELTK